MESISLSEYSKFQHLFTLSSNLEQLYLKIRTEINSDHTLHGSFNILNIIDRNKLLEISNSAKNNPDYFNVLELFYLKDIDIVCKDQESMNLFIIELNNLFNQIKIIDKDNKKKFNKLEFYNLIEKTKIEPIIPDNFKLFNIHMKSLFCSYLKIPLDDCELRYIIDINPRKLSDNSFFEIGELMFFKAQIINNYSKEKFNYTLFDIHTSKSFDYFKYRGLSSNFDKFIFELDYLKTDKLILNDPKKKYRISRILLCINLLINNYGNLVKFKDYLFPKSESEKNKIIEKIVSLKNDYLSLANKINLDVYYFKSSNLGLIKFDNQNKDRDIEAEYMINDIYDESFLYKIEQCLNSKKSEDANYFKKESIKIESVINTELNKYYDQPDCRFKQKLENYKEKLLNLDSTNNNIIYDYTANYFAIIISYLGDRLFDDEYYKKINDDIYVIYNTCYIMSKDFNNDFFFDQNNYFYVIRSENFISFKGYYTYITIPIGEEFVHPFPLSTSILSTIDYNKNIFLKIKIKKENIFCIILNYSKYISDREILIPHGTKFRVIDRRELENNKFLIELEIIGNIIEEQRLSTTEEYINYYKTNYISNKDYFRIINDQALICNIGNVEKYIKKLYNAIYSNTVPIHFEDNSINKIIKGYLFKKELSLLNSFEDYNHPLNIEIKLLELTKELLKQKKTPHLIESYNRNMNCNSFEFYNYVKKKLCKKSGFVYSSWLCNDIPSFNDKYFERMAFVSLEFADIGTLTNVLDKKIITKCKELYAVFFQIIYTLSVLYDYYGFIHFDLKPDNIMFMSDKNYNKTEVKYYKYNYKNNIYYIPVSTYIVKIADYDASFYCNVDNKFISKNYSHRVKVKSLTYSKIDLYMIFNLLSENISVYRNIKLINKDEDNKIEELYKRFNDTYKLNENEDVPKITDVLISENIFTNMFSDFKEIQAEESIVEEFTHLEYMYENLKQEPMRHNKIISHNYLKISDEQYYYSLDKIKVLRNNNNVLRIMTFNVHEWKDSFNNKNYIEMIKDIIEVFPDILCLQEDKDGLPNSYDNEDKYIKLFNNYYNKQTHCNADNNLINSIYVKKSIQERVENFLDENIGDGLIGNAAKRCSTIIKYKLKNEKEILIANTHLHFENLRQEALNNMKNLLNLISTNNNDNLPVIILGDFNNYKLEDITQPKLLDKFKEVKGTYYNPKQFYVCRHLERENWVDVYDNYLKDIDVKHGYIPLNTTRYGGRIDHVYLNENFISQQYKILGVYNLYTDSSDHSPIIVDILDYIEPFNGNFDNYIKQCKDKDNKDVKDVKIDKSLDDLINLEKIKNPLSSQLEANSSTSKLICNLCMEPIEPKSNAMYFYIDRVEKVRHNFNCFQNICILCKQIVNSKDRYLDQSESSNNLIMHKDCYNEVYDCIICEKKVTSNTNKKIIKLGDEGYIVHNICD